MRDDARSDGALLVAFAARDEDACAELVRRHLRAATLFATQLTGDRDEAEDVVQAAFIVAFDRARTLDPLRPFAPWLYGVVRRLALKRRARRARRWRLWRQWRDPADDHAQPTGEARVAVSSDLALIRRELTMLPAMQRACFELVALRDLSADDVAAMYEISPSTVRQHVFRARRTVRARLQGVLGPTARGALDETGDRRIEP